MSVAYEDLIRFAAGELPAERMADVEAAIAGDPRARRTVEQYRAARLTMSTDDSTAPPAEAMQGAKRIFDPSALSRPARWWETLDRLIATLVFDSRVQPAAVRYAEPGDRVQLAFEAGAIEVDLQAQRRTDAAGSWQVTGQIAADRAESCRVVLLRSDDGVMIDETTTDERGLFTLDTADGRYDLGVAVNDELIVMPALTLPAP